ncbi:hypothetical protein ACLOJK_019180 [Asimina triloba]
METSLIGAACCHYGCRFGDHGAAMIEVAGQSYRSEICVWVPSRWRLLASQRDAAARMGALLLASRWVADLADAAVVRIRTPQTSCCDRTGRHAIDLAAAIAVNFCSDLDRLLTEMLPVGADEEGTSDGDDAGSCRGEAAV